MMRKDPVQSSAKASRGWCKPGAMGNGAALCVAPGEESGVALVTGERGRGPVGLRQPEWYRESRLFVPGAAGVFILGSVPAGTAKGLIARPLETFSFMRVVDKR